MRAKPTILIGAALICLLLIVSLFVVLARPAPLVTVRHVKRTVSPVDGITEVFEIHNQTASKCYCYPIEVEVLQGTDWKPCLHIAFKPYRVLNFDAQGTAFCTLENPDLPSGRPLRLRVVVSLEQKGLAGAIARFNFRFRQGVKGISLNPFDKSSVVFGKSGEVSSDQFVEPAPGK